jgi:hypothetical protein
VSPDESNKARRTPLTRPPWAADALVLQRRLREHRDEVVAALNVWLWGIRFLLVWRDPDTLEIVGKPDSTTQREQYVDELIVSMNHLQLRCGRPVDYRRADQALEDGLRRLIGQRLGSTPGRVYRALTDLGAESQRYGVCRRCHTVFSRPRRDRVFCSQACRKTRSPRPRKSPSWVEVPGPRFAAQASDLRKLRVEAYCDDCARMFFASDDRQRYCERCAAPARRTARSRKRNSGARRPSEE